MRHRLLALFLFVLPVTGHSAWEIVHNFSNSVASIYFLHAQGHPEIGFVIGGNGWLYRTEDGGKKWSPIIIAGGFKYGLDIYFSSAATGYCTAWNGIIVTHDTGKSWSVLAPYNATSVIENPLTHRVFAATLTGGYSIHASGGAEQKFSNGILRSFATTDSSHMLVSCFENFDKFYFTTNGGLTWTQSWFGVEAWQPVGIPGTSTYFAVSEPFQGTNTLYRSDDWGNNWSIVRSFHASVRLTGTIRASRTALYIQSHESFYFSTDQGDTWIPFCGPPGQFDYRFYNVEDTIYAGDRFGNLWVNRNALEGPSVAPLGFAPTRLELGAKGCLPHHASVTINELTNCISLPTLFEKVELRGSGQFSLDTSEIQVGRQLQTRVFQIGVTYFPNGVRYDTAALFIRYKRMGIVFDTIIPIYAELVPTPSFKLLPAQVGMSFKYPCLLHDTVLTLRNEPCDTLVITAVTAVGDPGLTVSTPPLPYKLSPDSAFTMRTGSTRITPGTMYAGVRIRGISGKQAFDTILPVNIKIMEEVPLALAIPRRIDMGRTPTCATRYDTVTMENPYCEAVTIRSLTYASPGGEFKVSSPVLPVLLDQNEKLKLALEFTPKTAGLKSISLQLELARSLITKDTLVELRGTGVENGMLVVTDTGLFFDTISTCETATKSITLENESCNQITITELHLPIGFGSFSSSQKLPLILRGGERRTISVLFTPDREGQLRSKGSIRSQLSSSGEFDVEFPVECDVVRPLISSTLLPGSVTDSLTICQVADTVIVLTNRSLCDTLFVDSLSVPLDVSSAFSKIALAPDSSTVIPVRFIPPDTGTISSSLAIHCHTRYSPVDTAISFTYKVYGSDKLFAVQPNDIVFDTVPICASSDSTFSFTNSGCDTLSIISIKSEESSYILENGPMPINLAPGAAYSWRITSVPDTSNGRMDASGRILIELDDSTKIPVTLYSRYQYPAVIDVQIEENPLSCRAGDTIFFPVHAAIRHLSVSPPEPVVIRFTLDYDQDILHYIDAWNGLTSTDGKHFEWHFDIHQAVSNTLAQIRFRAMLSRKLETMVSLLDPETQLSTTSECLHTLSASGAASFQLALTCGDSIIAGFLRNNTIPNFTINPNPASNTIHLSCDQNVGTCTIRFFDGLSDLQKTVLLELKANEIVPIDLSDLGSGMYSIECDYGVGKKVLRAIVER